MATTHNTAPSISSIEELVSRQNAPVAHVSLSCGLRSVPREILDYAPTVEILDLSYNALDSLPDWFAELHSLKVLFLSGNPFREVPRVLQRCQSLRMLGMRSCRIEQIGEDALPSSLIWLTLTNNQIAELPTNFGTLRNIRKLLLAGNRLSNLPASCSQLQSLELLRISANNFESIPDWLFRLPRLAWLAIAGNPSSQPTALNIGCNAPIPWPALALKAELGRGASGSTYLATYSPQAGTAREVAVKVFESEISSDGAARDEIAAALRAGQHPGLTSTIAPFSNHPSNKFGLVLELIPPRFRNLAAPPNFNTCTRDVYPTDLKLSFSTGVSYALQIADVAAHLHEQGILHGDFYGHNILVDDSRIVLSDFGAACLYYNNPKLDKERLERVEIRSIGILIQEVLQHITESDRSAYSRQLQALERLVATCIDEPTERRPLCRTLCELLNRSLTQ